MTVSLVEIAPYADRPLPWQWFENSQVRQTVVTLLVCNTGLVVVGPNKDPTRTTYIFPQGGIIPGESILEAARREVREEIPSLRRPASRGPFRVGWDRAVYLGSALNETARSAIPKMCHCVALPVLHRSIVVAPEENWTGFWVWDPGTLEGLLEPTRLQNPAKWGIIRASILSTLRSGLLIS